jgi:CRP-like cAMP-binding protein
MRTSTLSLPEGKENRLLASLSARDLNLLLLKATLVQLSASEVLAEEGHDLRYVYFPVDCYIGVFASGSEMASMAVNLIGPEGMLGSLTMLGSRLLTGPAIVQGGGTSWRVSIQSFRALVDASDTFKRRIHWYLHETIFNLARQAACSHFHSIEARLARWLLMIHDRVEVDQFDLTHQMLADLLGVRRVGVTIAARALHTRALIDYSRGTITMLNRRGLVAAACSCYGVSEARFRKLLG